MDGKMHDGDEAAIRALIGAHFEGMKWSPDMQEDWSIFTSDFLQGATLVPAARPVQSKSPDQFIERMKRLAQGSLHPFEEHTRGMEILIFGKVAVVLAASEMLENGTDVNHDVSGYLLVKDDGVWRIAAHAWDKATEETTVPKHLR